MADRDKDRDIGQREREELERGRGQGRPGQAYRGRVAREVLPTWALPV